MKMNWNILLSQVLAQVGTVSAIIAILALVGKVAVEKFFQSGVEALKAELKRQNDLELAEVRQNFQKEVELLKSDLKHQNDLELARVRQGFQKELLDEKAKADQQAEIFHQALQSEEAAKERIRSQIVSWANPVLNAVQSLESRLNNILDHEGYVALNNAHPQPDPNWSVTYDYFLNSSMYSFAQYFCWVRFVELEFSFELFHKNVTKDKFFGAMIEVSKALGDYPRTYQGKDPDLQLFRLQQQAIGESMASHHGEKHQCIGYSTFLVKLPDATVSSLFHPLKMVLDSVKPGEKRWERLLDVRASVAQLRAECEALLK
jgi:hypothetical protein